MIPPKRIAVKLHPQAETILKKGHPWIFSDSISKQPGDARTGDVTVIFSEKDNKLIGVGLYDAHSPIRIKILSANAPLKIDAAYFTLRLEKAFNARMAGMPAATNAYRWVYGESDLLPGMIIDIYGDTVVLKLYSAMWLPYLDWIRDAIVGCVDPKAIVLRLSRNVMKALPDSTEEGLIYGTLDDDTIIFEEHGVRFSANVIRGHKTGYFLDHRHNRHEVGLMADGKTVLDVFSYAGGFSTHALAGGAREVVSVDISVQALEMARNNALLNAYSGQHTVIAGDAFSILNAQVQSRQQYDIVVIDPPSFAKKQSEVPLALKRYAELALSGARLCKKGGVLVLASCSSRVTKEPFLRAHEQAFKNGNYSPRLIKTTDHDWDHPVSIPESAYLKTAYYQM